MSVPIFPFNNDYGGWREVRVVSRESRVRPVYVEEQPTDVVWPIELYVGVTKRRVTIADLDPGRWIVSAVRVRWHEVWEALPGSALLRGYYLIWLLTYLSHAVVLAPATVK